MSEFLNLTVKDIRAKSGKRRSGCGPEHGSL